MWCVRYKLNKFQKLFCHKESVSVNLLRITSIPATLPSKINKEAKCESQFVRSFNVDFLE